MKPVPNAASIARATRKAVPSSYGAAATWTPVGTPFDAQPDGTATTGCVLWMLNTGVSDASAKWSSSTPLTVNRVSV